MEASPTLGQAEHHHLSDPGKEARSKSGIPVVPVFDGYRALAILGVVLLHLVTISGVVQLNEEDLLSRLTWGTVGRAVEVLFVVSGFVVFLPTVARRGDFGSILAYAVRRVARLFPAYWMILIISLVLILTVNPETGPDFPGIESLGTHWLGIHGQVKMFSSSYLVGFGVNGPIWTLSIEISFYFVLPFLASWYFRNPWIGLGLALALTVGWTFAFDHVGGIASALGSSLDPEETTDLQRRAALQLPTWAVSFALGMTGAWTFLKLRHLAGRPSFRRSVLWVEAGFLAALLGLVFVAGGHYGATRESIFLNVAISAVMATLMVAIALGPRAIQFPFANRPVRNLGDISYGIYLVHVLLAIYLAALTSLPQDGTLRAFLLWTAAVLPASVLYGYLSARFVEQPIRRWARRFGRRAQPGSK